MLPFFIVAAILILSNLTEAIAERLTDRKLRRKLRFWSKIGSIFLTVALVGVNLWTQRTAQQATGERLAGELSNILNTQQSEFNKQATKQERALNQLELSLDQARSLEKNQEAQTRALVQQQEDLRGIIVRQSGEMNLLNRIPLNRNLSEIEISYTPSKEKWRQIAVAFNKIKSPEPDLPYADAPMNAEIDGDHWKIDFEPTQIKGEEFIVLPNGTRVRKGGNKKLPKVSTRENPQFEEVLRQAFFGMKIAWGNGSNTVLDPDDKYYPSAMHVSQSTIKLILRPPLVLWSLNEIDENPVITFFGQDYPLSLPENLTIRSLDPSVVLDQNIQLNWVTRVQSDPPTYDQQKYRKFSGAHDLDVYFAVFDPSSGKRNFRRAGKSK